MGGKYKSFLMLTYRVFSLIPAIAIGVHILLRLWFDREVNCLRIFSKTFAIIYTIIFEAAWLYFLYASGPRKQHQNDWQRTKSFQSAMTFYIYYYAVLVYGPAWFLSLIFMVTPRLKKTKVTAAMRNLTAADLEKDR